MPGSGVEIAAIEAPVADATTKAPIRRCRRITHEEMAIKRF
jgi:hypothetical protein